MGGDYKINLKQSNWQLVMLILNFNRQPKLKRLKQI
jgi:hypothetical protein